MSQFQFVVRPTEQVVLSSEDAYRACYTVPGTLIELELQFNRLNRAGFDILILRLDPSLPDNHPEEYKKTLQYIFDNRVGDWFNHEKALIQYGICTQEEYDSILKTRK